MAIGSVLNAGVNGMQRSSAEMQKSAYEVASFGTSNAEPKGTLAEPIVNMQFEPLIFEASAKVVSTASETLGTLIDIKS